MTCGSRQRLMELGNAKGGFARYEVTEEASEIWVRDGHPLVPTCAEVMKCYGIIFRMENLKWLRN